MSRSLYRSAEWIGRRSFYARIVRSLGWRPVAVGEGTGLLVLGAAWAVGPVTAIPLAAAVGAVAGVLAGWPNVRQWLPWATVVAATASLGATMVTLVIPYTGSAAAGL